MSRLPALLIGALLPLAISTQAPAQGDTEWIPIDDAGEVRALIAGKELNGGYWRFYFRADGKMAYEQADFISFREWSIDDDGAISMSIYSMPDKIIDCQSIEGTEDSAPRYRIRAANGNFEIEITEPSGELVSALLEKAGPQ